jgi:hypothetical protein
VGTILLSEAYRVYQRDCNDQEKGLFHNGNRSFDFWR